MKKILISILIFVLAVNLNSQTIQGEVTSRTSPSTNKDVYLTMPRIIEYRLVIGRDYPKLVEEVNKLIKAGWQPLGPIQISSERESIQTMVKYR